MTGLTPGMLLWTRRRRLRSSLPFLIFVRICLLNTNFWVLLPLFLSSHLITNFFLPSCSISFVTVPLLPIGLPLLSSLVQRTRSSTQKSPTFLRGVYNGRNFLS